MRIKQDPSQFDLFIDILRDTEGMNLIVTTLVGGELGHTRILVLPEHCAGLVLGNSQNSNPGQVLA